MKVLDSARERDSLLFLDPLSSHDEAFRIFHLQGFDAFRNLCCMCSCDFRPIGQHLIHYV